MTLRALFMLTVALLPSLAGALNPVDWAIDVTINRGDTERFWSSPTAIDLGLDSYSYGYEITSIVATTTIPIPVDITSQVGESFDLTGNGDVSSLPVTLIEAPVSDAATGTRADIRILVDGSGFGQASFTNIALGSVQTPLGALAIQTVRVQASVTLSGFIFQPGDYNGDGAVDPSDYAAWASAYGRTTPSPADGNDDGVVNAADYTIWRDRYDSPLDAVAVPEPAAGLLGLFAWCGFLLKRR